MGDKPQDIGTESLTQREKDVVDYNHELAGSDNGRIKRFSVDSSTLLNSQGQEKRKSRERQFTSMLAYMLENDAQYRALYFETEIKLEEAQTAVDEALLRLNRDLDDIAYQLDNADALGLSAEQQIALRLQQDELERHKEEIEAYQHDVIDHIRNRMGDEHNPPSKDELEGLREQIETQRPELLNDYMRKVSPVDVSASEALIGKSNLSKIELCQDFCVAHDDTKVKHLTSDDEPNFAPLGTLGK